MELPDISILKPPPVTKALLVSPASVFAAAVSLRVVLLVYGLYQDAHSPFKYTDIDYNVFTDAARYLSRGQSPYARATYRYTPLLAWALLPTTWGGWWFQFGKALFAVADIVAGWLIFLVLRRRGFTEKKALVYSSIWLLNPMVATISTRGSSEGLLCVIVVGLLWAATEGHVALTGLLLGFGVHFKIYPFIYGTSILWAMESTETLPSSSPWTTKLSHFFNTNRVNLIFTALATFSFLNITMFLIYGEDFILHTYLHHLTRIDHRHNFSPYNTLLYLSSSGSIDSPFSFESLAFLPQLLLSVIAIPLALAKHNISACMLAQTFAFVTFNKVCTSQYFLWYLVFLPLYLPESKFLREPKLGVTALALWVAGQALWLQQGYELEFNGKSTFVPGLWLSSLLFFAINVWILGVIVEDGSSSSSSSGGGTVSQGNVTTASNSTSRKTKGSGKGNNNDDDNDNDNKNDESEVEEIEREESIDDMIKRERRLGHQQEANLRAYMADIRDFM